MSERQHRWTLALLAYPLAERTVAGWTGLPHQVRRRWLLSLAGAYAAATLLCVGLTLWGMRAVAAGALDWERSALLSLPDRVPLDYHDAVWLGAFGSTAMLVPVAFTAGILLALHGQVVRAIGLLVAYFLAKPLIFTGWWIWDRARPTFFESAAAVPAGLPSFPSGHVLQTVAVYGLLTWYWVHRSRSRIEQTIAWALLTLLVLTQVLSRMRIGAHWPTDVVAGVLVGALWMAGVAWAGERAERGRRAVQDERRRTAGVGREA